ncbi:type II secretion system F family protein [Streptomyces sp. H10-C2]|uniref:type II secretion system F family protein n=1 Tax=unclassified Streptomyces TaxID=2593676 RepID=UPI0024BA2E42|nr:MULTISPECIES: type II secretion system F family protein [unclassified Streptomyces]MDJ0346177.1 type II secretion system F family protein [Streptomyces sp. PH10-H1]MDJ0374836.1 type II secretion system F family protein [Streptomyces sp. H10-C2]
MNGDRIHSMGTAVSVAAAVLCLAVTVIEARRERVARGRLRLLFGVRITKTPDARWWTRLPVLRSWFPVAAVALGAAVFVGGVPGCVTGLLAAYGTRRWQRRSRKTGGSVHDEGSGRQLPLCADLMAACLAAGGDPRDAAEAVGRSLGGPLGDGLIRVAAELRLGGDPVRCWERFGQLPAARGLARCLARASHRGVAPVDEVARLAADYRAARGRAALGRARRAGVLATAPLGLCFLPAFLLVGVVPVVMGLAAQILAGGSS